VLGLTPDADAEAIGAARRDLAKAAHPDAGGSAAAMQRVNLAAEAALAIVTDGPPGVTTGTRGDGVRRTSPPRDRPRRPDEHRPLRTDHPSFTVEALPVETFEALLIAAAALGQVIDDEPPYRLEVALAEPVRGWCRLDVVPDAGASTVSLAVGPEPGFPTPGVEAVRDQWIAALNGLDWAQLEH
jgi:hypothetical protein